MTTIQGTDGGRRVPGNAIGDRGEHFLRAVARRSRDLVIVLNPDRTVAYVSRPLGPVLGYDDDRPVEHWAGQLDDDQRDAIHTALDRAVEVPGTPVPLAMQVCRPHGPDRWFEGDVTDLCSDPSVAGIVIRFLDVSRERLVRQELHTTRYRDPVTGLPNREHFLELVAAAAARSAAVRRPVHVALLDLDDFRRLNDSLGHEWGDRLLIAVAARLACTLRPGDRLARLGGDEFAVLLDDIPADGSAEAVVRRLRVALEQPFLVDGRHLAVSACFGLAAHGGTADELLRDAELAMHQAKATGRGRWTAFRPGMERAAVDLLDLEIDLRQAVLEGALHVAYQPIVHLVRNEVVGVEALARWDRPGHGAVPPDQFIPLAEQLRIIGPLGRSILEQACRDAAMWNTAPGVDLGLSVNLSALQLDDPSLVSDVEGVLHRTGLRPDLLTLEITESTLMRDVVATTQRLHALRSLGVSIAVDDFGTGYSSLAHLCEVPVDVLKIDRSFVAALGDHGRADTLGRVIVDLGRGIGAETVAEGIETPEQAAFLRRLGCPLGQGFLYGRPMPADLVPDYLRNTPTRTPARQAASQKATA